MLDVTSHDSCERAIKKVESMMAETGLPLVAIVNNAGGSRYLPIEFQDIRDARDLFNTNFFGVMNMIQLTLPLLRASKGRIVNISSIAGIFAPPLQGLYCATKFAVEGMSDSLRREVAHFGISVSLVEPAYVKTPIVETTQAASTSSDAAHEALKQQLYAKFYTEQARKDKLEELAYGDHPEVVSQVIDHAISSPTPRVRYVVANALKGVPAYWLTWLFWLLPARVMDQVLNCG